MSSFTKSLKVFFLVLAFSSGARVFASNQTGSFNTSINFLGASRQIGLYVPGNYDSTKSYSLMVCLHGLGDTYTNYRDALISLSFASTFPNTIFVCPEAASNVSDFTLPAGNEAIINECIKYARNNYNIDTTNIILQGFSLGGRAALKYGLENYSEFKGLLLNTPAIQGVKEAMNKNISGYTFKFENASKIPIFISHGVDDILYTNPIDTAFESMVYGEGMVKKNRKES